MLRLNRWLSYALLSAVLGLLNIRPLLGQNQGSRFLDSLYTLNLKPGIPLREKLERELFMAWLQIPYNISLEWPHLELGVKLAAELGDQQLLMRSKLLNVYAHLHYTQHKAKGFRLLEELKDEVLRSDDSRSLLIYELIQAKWVKKPGETTQSIIEEFRNIARKAERIADRDVYVLATIAAASRSLRNRVGIQQGFSEFRDLLNYCNKYKINQWKPFIAISMLRLYDEAKESQTFYRLMREVLDIMGAEGDYINHCLSLALAAEYEVNGKANYPEALRYLDQCDSILTIHPFPQLQCRLNNFAALCLIQAGEVPEAEQKFRWVLQNSDQYGDRIDAYRGLGQIYTHKARFSEAAIMMDSSIFYARWAAIPHNIVGLLCAQAQLFMELGEADKVIQNCREVVRLIDWYGPYRTDADRNYSFVSYGYLEYGYYDSSEYYAAKALKFALEINDAQSIALAYHALASAMRAKGDYAQEQKYNREYLNLTKSWNNRKHTMIAYSDMARMYQQKGNHKEALDYFDSSLAISVAIDAQSRIPFLYRQKAEIYTTIGMYTKAVEMIELAMESGKIRDENLLVLAGIYQETGNYRKAIETYQEAIELFSKKADLLQVARIHYHKSASYQGLKDFAGAGKALDESLKIFGSLRDSLNIALVLLKQAVLALKQNDTGEAYRLLHEVQNGPYPELKGETEAELQTALSDYYTITGQTSRAMLHLNKAIQKNRLHGKVNALLKNLEAKSKAFEKIKRYDSAYKVYLEYITIRDSIHNISVRNEITRKELEFGFKQKEAEFLQEKERGANEIRFKDRELQLSLQRIQLANNEIALRNKDLDLQHLAQLRTQAELHNQKLETRSQTAENEIKASRIALLDQQRLLQQVELTNRKRVNHFLLAGLIILILLSSVIGFNWLRQRNLNRQIKDSNQALQQAMTELTNTQKELIEAENEKNLAIEKTRIALDLHDDLGGGLTKIAIMSELLNNSREVKPAAVADIARTANELVDNMSQIIWVMNPENDKLENLFGYMRKYALDYFEDSAIHCEVYFQEDVDKIHLSHSVRRNLFLVVKEILHNTMKHSGAMNVTLEASMEDRQLQMVISDDGRGFRFEESRTRGNGLNNMMRRMAEAGGTVRVEQNPEGGCVHRIACPLGMEV